MTDSAAYFINGQGFDAPVLVPALYIVATPIGNLKDITLRALEMLAAADMIVCEDTRVTSKLLSHFGISTKMQAFHDHSGEKKATKIIKLIQQDQVVCLVSDAGTPLICDPGFELVTLARHHHVPVIPAPGASAFLAGLVSSGFASAPFAFFGFLPAKRTARKKMLQQACQLKMPVCFYESPHRFLSSLKDIAQVFGSHARGYFGRELTKKFETHETGTIVQLIEKAQAMDKVRGELMLVIEPDKDHTQQLSQSDIDAQLTKALKTMKLKDATCLVAAQLGINKRHIYQRALELKDRG